MSKVKRRVVGAVGDVNPVEYGGGYVFRIPHQGHWLEYVEWDSDSDDAEGSLYCGTLDAEPGTWVNVDDVVGSVGADKAEWLEAARSKNAMSRAGCTMDIYGHYGWANFDAYPQRVARKEVARRWCQCGVKRKRKCKATAV